MGSGSSRSRTRALPVLEWLVYVSLVWATCWPWRAMSENEMDTIPAARQWADPSWLPKDWYLGLDIPYREPFNLLVGPVAAAWGLEAGAVVGRVLAILLTAAALVALLRALGIDRWVALAPVTLYLQHQSLVAGEWVVGAAEAKALAYPFAIAAVAAAARRRFGWAAGLLGAATTFHVLVGLYVTFAVVVAVLVAQLLAQGEDHRLPGPAALLPFAITGAWGSWIVLGTATEPAGESSAGWRVYVSFRVRHHVMPQHWEQLHAVPWLPWLAAAAVVSLAILVRGTWPWRVLAGTVVSTIGLFAVGLLLSQAGRDDLLRYYWFRTGDTWVPLATALAVAGALSAATSARRRPLRGVVVAAGLALATVWSVTDLRVTAREETRRAEQLSSSDEVRAMRWVDEHLPPDAVVAADPAQLYWYPEARRASVALYKSSPQSGEDVAAWAHRLELLSGRSVGPSTTTADLSRGHRTLSPQGMVALAQTGATHYVATRPDIPAGTCELHRAGRVGVFELAGSPTCP